MKKLFIITTAVIAAATVFLALGMLSDDSSASYSSTFGSDSVGAERIVFDSNGGSGGYAQYVLNGNSVYFPTEYKASGISNNTYQQVTRNGYVLLGWSESPSASSPTYHPGQSYTVTVPKTFYAVWGSTAYSDRFFSYTESVYKIPVGQTIAQAIEANDGINYCRESVVDTITVTLYKGTSPYTSSTYYGSMRYFQGISTDLTSGWATADLHSSSSYNIRGTPTETGTFTFEMKIVNAQGYTFYSKNVFVVYDPNTDPSNIMHVTYNGNDAGYGPYHTAVKLPDSVTTKQKGWNVTVDGSPAIFPVGGSYTLVKKETVLTVNEYTFDEVAASGVAGVIAYNANGGFYNGSFAELVPTDGYTALKNGSIVTKSGYSFLGWNTTGLSTDPIYPSGYLYGIQGEYTELKAVWGTAGSPVTLYFENPGDGSQNFSAVTFSGYRYALPVNGIALSGYDFMGWSETRYDVGMGTADAGNSVLVSSSKTYYAVFQPKVYSCTIRYDGNGGIGTMNPQTETVSSVPHYMTVSGCAFAYAGYSFAGWSETRYAESPSYAAGSSYCFTDGGDVTLYAVWTENTVSEYNTFHLIFNGNGPSVTNVPPQAYRITSERSVDVYVPSAVPQRDDYRFIGWSETTYGSASYSPGQKITLSLGEGQSTRTLTLFAVWEQRVIGGDGTSVTVTFVADSGTLRSVQVPSGNAVTMISAPAVEGRAFLGWFNLTEKWDFSAPVTSNLTLTAKYLPIFHLDIDGTTVKVILDCTSSSTKVQFSDGFSKTYDSATIPGHTVANNTSGSVTVTVSTEGGSHTAVCHYTVSDKASSTEEEEHGIEFGSVYWIAGGIIGILALFVVGRMFL